jgi:membrane protease YdiL (CAAX protease family)
MDLFAARRGSSRAVLESLLAFLVATAGASGLYRLQGIPFIHQNLHALVAAIFLALPHFLLRGPGELERHGFTSHPRRLGLTIAAIAIFGFLPLFSVGFWLWVKAMCLHLHSLVPGSCARALHPQLRLPPDLLLLSLSQVLVVALPEELFFRAYLQGRLEDAWPPSFELFGAKVGRAWLLQALLFALGHYCVTLEPQMLTRFFPGLAFGWMYARTRSILAGTLFHAACNLVMDVLILSLV